MPRRHSLYLAHFSWRGKPFFLSPFPLFSYPLPFLLSSFPSLSLPLVIFSLNDYQVEPYSFAWSSENNTITRVRLQHIPSSFILFILLFVPIFLFIIFSYLFLSYLIHLIVNLLKQVPQALPTVIFADEFQNTFSAILNHAPMNYMCSRIPISPYSGYCAIHLKAAGLNTLLIGCPNCISLSKVW